MHSFIAYALGLMTLPALFVLWNAVDAVIGHKEHKRFKRAWDKFSEEYKTLSPETITALQLRWKEEPWKYAHICDDESRYFTFRWQHGHTTEV